MVQPSHIEDQIVTAIRRIIRAVDLHSRWLSEEYGLTGPQLVVLKHILRQGPVSSGVLARAVHLTPATLTGILDRLLAKGLILRARADKDRRMVTVTITRPGEELLRHVPSLLQERFREHLGGLPEWEQHHILATLLRIASMMDAESLDAAPHLVSEEIFPESGGDPDWPPIASEKAAHGEPSALPS